MKLVMNLFRYIGIIIYYLPLEHISNKVDYSRLIREASMVVEKLPEVNPPSCRVPGPGLLVPTILEARQRRNRGEIAKKDSVLRGFGTRGKYRRRGQPGVDQGVQEAPGAT